MDDEFFMVPQYNANGPFDQIHGSSFERLRPECLFLRQNLKHGFTILFLLFLD
jgi:hypothetical protein